MSAGEVGLVADGVVDEVTAPGDVLEDLACPRVRFGARLMLVEADDDVGTAWGNAGSLEMMAASSYSQPKPLLRMAARLSSDS